MFLRVTFFLLILLHAIEASADNRAKFLSLLSRKSAPTIEELKPFYRRDPVVPLREQPQFKNRDLITALGKKLFYEPRLSSSATMACVTCHKPEMGWTDGLARSVEANRRRSMSLYNLAWDKRFTWNGMAGSLMSQAILALGAQGGMSVHFEAIPEKIGTIPEYQKLFEQAFGNAVPKAYRIGPDTIAVALEYYVSSIVSEPTPFDRWIAGNENAISSAAKSGFLLFNGKAQCAFCHNSWRFSDGEIYDTGLSLEPARGKDQFQFKSVGLRNIANRPPYMHDGSLQSLVDVIEFYNRGGNLHRGGKSPHVRKLELSESETADLAEFLKTL